MRIRICMLIFCFLGLSIGSIAQQLTDSLLLHFPLDGSAIDRSTNGFNGIIYGSTPTTDRHGNPTGAMFLDGVDDYIDFPNDSNLKPQYPISFSYWVKFEDLSAVHSKIFTNDFLLDNYTGFTMTCTAGQLDISYGSGGITNSSNRRTSRADSVLSSGIWYHLVGIIRGPTDMSIYIGGDSVTATYSGSGTSNVAYSNFPGCLGRTDQTNRAVDYFWGSLDDFRFWNRAISTQEVNQLLLSSGIDTCIVTVYDTISVTDTLIIDIITGIAPPNNINTLKVYPNPTASFITIDAGNLLLIPNYSVRIINSLSQQVYLSPLNSNTLTVNLNQLGSKGLYFIQILNSTNQVVQMKQIILN